MLLPTINPDSLKHHFSGIGNLVYFVLEDSSCASRHVDAHGRHGLYDLLVNESDRRGGRLDHLDHHGLHGLHDPHGLRGHLLAAYALGTTSPRVLDSSPACM